MDRQRRHGNGRARLGQPRSGPASADGNNGPALCRVRGAAQHDFALSLAGRGGALYCGLDRDGAGTGGGAVSLTFVTRLLLFLLLAAPAAVAGGHYGPQLADYLSQARVSTAQEARFESRAIVYRLESDRVTTFAFSQPVQLFKRIVHPKFGEADRVRTEGIVNGFRFRMINRKSGR